jgi:cyclic beta-1,2-glucan synthetase
MTRRPWHRTPVAAWSRRWLRLFSRTPAPLRSLRRPLAWRVLPPRMPGEQEPPIRAELLGAAGFLQLGLDLALAHGEPTRAGRAAPFFPRLRQNVTVLHQAHAAIAQQERNGRHISPAGAWLLDNIHLVVAQTREVHDGLPRRYFRGLPVLAVGPLAGLPRVYAIAWSYVAHADSAFDPRLLIELLQAYQQHQPLTQGELWALPTTLRVVLVENLRRLAERVAAEEAARETAHGLCDALARRSDDTPARSEGEAPHPHDGPQALFAHLQQRGMQRAFALQVMQRLHADSETGTLQGARQREAIRTALAQALPEPAAAQASQQVEQAADNLSVGNAIRSLQLLGSADWRGLIAQASTLMRSLLTWPPFAAERDDTQDGTLHVIEKLARKSRLSEDAVAQVLLGLARQGGLPADGASTAAPSSLGYWVLGEGRATLNVALGLRTGLDRARLRRAAVPVLVVSLGLGTLALCMAFMAWAAPISDWRELISPLWLLSALLALWPASETVIAAVNRLVSESVPPSRLPRLDLAAGIPPEHAVLVVLPALITSSATIQGLVRRLERHHLANREPYAQFALLTDFADAATEQTDQDLPLLTETRAAIEALEARHALGPDSPRRFLLLHRQRQWSAGEERWIGWERKRGKLEQLVALLAGRPERPFMDLGACSQPREGTPYIVTLDADTVLPPGALRELVGLAAHPLNQPRLGPDGSMQGQRVVAGHGILQPRIVSAWPTDGAGKDQATAFHWLFAGANGSDPYNAVASEVYQDVFDEGSFTGKGLLNVAALHAVLAGRLPEGQVLSHDLVEGCFTRCASVSDVALIEPAPTHADVAASRTHRWTRGDWQLLPLLGRSRAYGLRAIDRWKLLDNLRRSLVVPTSLLLLLIGLAGGPVSPWAALALSAAAFAAGPLVGALAGLAPSRDDLALLHFARQALAELSRAALGLAWHVALWWRQALLLLDAISRALWRTRVSRRGLLQWTTAAAAEAAAAQGGLALLRLHAPLSLGALLLGAALWAAGTPTPGLALLMCALWAATPLWIALASRPSRPAAELSRDDQAYLLAVARDTWDWFALHVGTASHHLPPDNVQTVPRTMVAERTSPTNIGLYLLSLACARAFGWVTPGEMATRLQATLDTLDRLPRERGHFLNWIDTQSLQTLLPAYVSTVDSGNLCGHLLVVAQACESAGGGLAEQSLLKTLATRCRRLAEAADFAFLYDPRRRLLHIGYRVAEQTLDVGHYDLLASESRLASLWAIAKGDVPAAHWAALGRPFVATPREVGLRSWSGSMFEYLMPALVLDEPAGSALGAASHMAVQEQRDYARQHHLPWGVSESAYAAADRSLAYQYAPQGVPRLALRRTPPDERVVAPYASALAAMLEPKAATANLRALQVLRARSRWGFIEALDYTAARQTDAAGSEAAGTDEYTLVSTFMAHHQGMTLVSLANVLLQGLPRRWALADARLAAVAPLLQERVPREVARLQEPDPAIQRREAPENAVQTPRDVQPGAHALQRTQLLGNGRYSVALRANGAGFSRLGGIDITRWRDDALRDEDGSFFYLRRPGQASPVSLSQHPAPDADAHYTASFHADRVCLDATWPDLRSRVTTWVSPEDDIELRRVELWNTSSRPITLELMSAWEVCLSAARADEMHPAFANLFIGADWHAEDQALYLTRQPRRDDDPALHAVHFVVQADAGLSGLRASADRAQWRGRLRESWRPLAHFEGGATATGPCPTGLDPVAALALRLTLPPHGTAAVTLATAAAHHRATLETLVDRYREASGAERSSQLSATWAALRQLEKRLAHDELLAVQTLATLLVLLHSRPAPPATEVRCDRRLLWRLGISGDRPLIVVQVAAAHGLRLLGVLVQGLQRWSFGGVACDLVLVNAEPRSYLQPLQHELLALQQRHVSESTTSTATPGTLVVVQTSDLSDGERATLALMARVRMNADGRPLAHHVADLVAWHDAAQTERDSQDLVALQPPAISAAPPHAPGAFDAVSGDYRFDVSALHPTPRPWVNVLANPGFGALVSEAGAGCTWAGNSRLHQITPWNNDPLADLQGETFCVQDLRTREVWNLGAGTGCVDGPYRVRHSTRGTRISHRRGMLALRVTWQVDSVAAVKRVRVHLHNHGPQAQRLRVVGMLDWLLGAVRADRLSVRTAYVAAVAETSRTANAWPLGVLLATQIDDHDGAAGHTAFVALRQQGWPDATLNDWTCDRRELFDGRGRGVLPDYLGQQAGGAADPCAALSTRLRLEPGAEGMCEFVIGHAATPQDALLLARQSLFVDADAATAADPHGLHAVHVQTPDPLFDALVNHWLLHQTTACRLWGRAGFYQAGGAYGFRDQLQDAMALTVTAPELLREHLLRAAARQFVEGDVQHWWHPHSGAGVRTRFSDDLLWLPHAALHYVATTGDQAVYDAEVPFIEGAQVPTGAEDLYSVPQISGQVGSLYEHCARTLDLSLAVGVNGLPLMGGGDWNDGMNRVGSGGRGESVWLAWFLCRLVAEFAPLARQRGDGRRSLAWCAAAHGWQAALQGPAWDGAWYRRAFFDDGSPLGASANPECRIDLIAQAWSVLSGTAPLARQQVAMASARQLLTDPAHGLLRLLDPPLATAVPSAGYIQAYPRGVRENGGQYNHGTLWAAAAWAALGDGDAAWQAWVAASPAHRAADPVLGPLYGLEPYAAAADVYSQAPYAGRGGWSWYTGSAAGLHRTAVGSILGLQVQGQRVRCGPSLPRHWPRAEITLQRSGRTHRFTLCAENAAADIEQALAQGAEPLQAGAWLDLATTATNSHHLVRCTPGEPRPVDLSTEGANHELGPHRRPMEPNQGQGPRTVGQVDR